MSKTRRWIAVAGIAAAAFVGSVAKADVIVDWNIRAMEVVVEARMSPPASYRVMAIVQTTVYDAVNATTGRYPGSRLQAAPGASVDAAVAAANRATLSRLVPSQQALIDSHYRTAIAKVTDPAAAQAGVAVGEQAAAIVLAARAEDGADRAETYRPPTAAGTYIPTALPVAFQWPQRKPWLMSNAAQFRPGPPPALTSATWARDYNEIKALGGRTSTQRTAEQTEIARFWEATQPPIYFGIVRSVADVPGREVTRNARLYAAVAQAIDDSLIAVFDAKYQYNFWRPMTAIRNGDQDGNDATERDPAWLPFIDTPMHPEYPCAHCILGASVCTVLEAEIGSGPMPTLTTTSSTAKNTARSWKTPKEFMVEVANARIYDGVHYRNSTEVGTAMGKQVGDLAVAKFVR